jgi:hypothetical protein
MLMHTIVVIDDEPELLSMLQDVLEGEGYPTERLCSICGREIGRGDVPWPAYGGRVDVGAVIHVHVDHCMARLLRYLKDAGRRDDGKEERV